MVPNKNIQMPCAKQLQYVGDLIITDGPCGAMDSTSDFGPKGREFAPLLGSIEWQLPTE